MSTKPNQTNKRLLQSLVPFIPYIQLSLSVTCGPPLDPVVTDHKPCQGYPPTVAKLGKFHSIGRNCHLLSAVMPYHAFRISCLANKIRDLLMPAKLNTSELFGTNAYKEGNFVFDFKIFRRQSALSFLSADNWLRIGHSFDGT